MSIKNINDKGGTDFEIMPEDTHIARCYAVIDLGTQRGEYQGKEKIQGKFMLLFEVPSCRIDLEDGSYPMAINKEYTKSTGDRSNLYKDLTSWKGRKPTDDEIASFDATKLAGVPCQIQVIHKTSAKKRVYANINTITKVVAGMEVPAQENPSVVYELTEGFVPETIPEWIQDKIKDSLEWKGEIPFEGAEESQAPPPEEATDVEPF